MLSTSAAAAASASAVLSNFLNALRETTFLAPSEELNAFCSFSVDCEGAQAARSASDYWLTEAPRGTAAPRCRQLADSQAALRRCMQRGRACGGAGLPGGATLVPSSAAGSPAAVRPAPLSCDVVAGPAAAATCGSAAAAPDEVGAVRIREQQPTCRYLHTRLGTHVHVIQAALVKDIEEREARGRLKEAKDAHGARGLALAAAASTAHAQAALTSRSGLRPGCCTRQRTERRGTSAAGVFACRTVFSMGARRLVSRRSVRSCATWRRRKRLPACMNNTRRV